MVRIAEYFVRLFDLGSYMGLKTNYFNKIRFNVREFAFCYPEYAEKPTQKTEEKRQMIRVGHLSLAVLMSGGAAMARICAA